MDILEMMRHGTQARFPVRLRNFEIWLRPLTISETIQVASEVSEDLNSRPQIARTALHEHVIFATKTLALASTTKPGSKDPKLTIAVLQDCTPDELSYLFKSYTGACDKVNPSLEEISVDRLNELVAIAKKNPIALTECSFSELVSICRCLLQTLPVDR